MYPSHSGLVKKKKPPQQKKGLCINTYICKCQPQNRKKNSRQCCGPGGDGNGLVLRSEAPLVRGKLSEINGGFAVGALVMKPIRVSRAASHVPTRSIRLQTGAVRSPSKTSVQAALVNQGAKW